MAKNNMAALLKQVADHQLSVDAAMAQLDDPGFIDLDYAKVDTDRQRRTGYPEVIYGEGKTAEQIIGIIQAMLTTKVNILVTRVSQQKADQVLQAYPDMTYRDDAQVMLWQQTALTPTTHKIAVVTAGTSDLKVAEEAALTAEAFGNVVSRVYDVGVAGIHRLFARLDVIRDAQVVIVIAVPTSVGYGSSFGGMSALLTMLNSCASGITVVNIDNGFGAGYSASQINYLTENK